MPSPTPSLLFSLLLSSLHISKPMGPIPLLVNIQKPLPPSNTRTLGNTPHNIFHLHIEICACVLADSRSTPKRPIIKSQLQASLFGYGGLFDCLTLTSGDSRGAWVNINPVLILSFVESVLGYTLVESKSGGESQWYFKREGGFRK